MPPGREDPDEVRVRVARRIVELREEAGLTQREVAEAVGFDTSSYARMESGTENLTLRTITLIAATLGRPTVALFEMPTVPASKRPRGRPKKKSAAAPK